MKIEDDILLEGLIGGNQMWEEIVIDWLRAKECEVCLENIPFFKFVSFKKAGNNSLWGCIRALYSWV